MNESFAENADASAGRATVAERGGNETGIHQRKSSPTRGDTAAAMATHDPELTSATHGPSLLQTTNFWISRC